MNTSPSEAILSYLQQYRHLLEQSGVTPLKFLYGIPPQLAAEWMPCIIVEDERIETAPLGFPDLHERTYYLRIAGFLTHTDPYEMPRVRFRMVEQVLHLLHHFPHWLMQESIPYYVKDNWAPVVEMTQAFIGEQPVDGWLISLRVHRTDECPPLYGGDSD